MHDLPDSPGARVETSRYVAGLARVAWYAALVFVFGCVALAAAGWLAGCAESKPALAGGVYSGQLASCVDRATTLAESKACRAKVDAAWYPDGGAR